VNALNFTFILVIQCKTKIVWYVGIHSVFLCSCDFLLEMNARMQETGNSFYINSFIMFMDLA
jgi:hypothetical protein